MFLPLAEHFHIPANAMASNSLSVHSGGGSGRLKKKSNFEPNVICHDVHPRTKIVEVVYHWRVLLRVGLLAAETPISNITPEDIA